MSLPYFTWVPGTIVVVGKQPDGDSVRFVPRDQAALSHIYRAHLLRPSRSDGSHQLRLDGIDAPETHYGNHAQPFGDDARDELLKHLLGFRQIVFRKETVTSAEPDTLAAAILTQAADIHGRPICYLLIGKDAENPFGGADTGRVDVKLLQRTVNFHMVESGHAYPLLYTSAPREHRDLLTRTAQKARQEEAGVWKHDATPRFALLGRDSIEAGSAGAQLIFPKLFRRATDYLTAVDRGFEGDLVDWLEQTPQEDDQVVIAGTHEVPLSVLVRRENDRYRFDADVTEAVFVER